MSKQEIKKRLEENEKHQFMLQMVDRWTEPIKQRMKELWKEERELKALLEG